MSLWRGTLSKKGQTHVGVRTVQYSDLSGKTAEDGQQLVRLVVHEHPDLEDGPVRIEALPEEVEALEQLMPPVVLDLYMADDETPIRIAMEVNAFNRLAKDSMAAVLKSAERVTPTTRKRPAVAPSNPKRDYGSVEWAGTPHRGKVTDEERDTVRTHLDAVNDHLRARGERLIDLGSKEHVERYGLHSLAKERGITPA
jgi:hypothetical protein